MRFMWGPPRGRSRCSLGEWRASARAMHGPSPGGVRNSRVGTRGSLLRSRDVFRAAAMTVRFSAEAEPEPARRERWHDLIAASLGPIEPHGVPDELLLGDAGPVVVGELVQHAPGGATRTRR